MRKQWRLVIAFVVLPEVAAVNYLEIMFSENQEYRISVQAVRLTALVYLLLPNLLFLFGWVRPCVAIPLMVLLFIGVFCVWKQSRGSKSMVAPCIRCSKQDLIYLVAALLLGLLLTDMIGFHGHVMQDSDFRVRNPIYRTLIEQDWPVFSSRGEYFIYNHISWLVPALLCKICGSWLSSATALFCWMYLGLSIALLVLFLRLRRYVFIFMLALICYGAVSTLVHEILVFLFPMDERWENLVALTAIRGGGYIPFYVQWMQFFNHVLPCMICLSLFLSKCIPLRYMAVPAALMVMSSPMAAAALFIILLFSYLRNPRELLAAMCSWQVWVCVVFLICGALYFLGQQSSGLCMLWSENPYAEMMSPQKQTPNLRMVRYISGLVWLLLPLYLIVQKKLRRTMWWKIIVLLAVALPLVWIGRVDNQLLSKGGLVLCLLCIWLLAYQWKISKRTRKCFILLFLLCSSSHIAGSFIHRDFLHYTWSQEGTMRHIYDPWKGTLNHPELYEYNNFWGKVLVPEILYDKPGESVSVLRSSWGAIK